MGGPRRLTLAASAAFLLLHDSAIGFTTEPGCPRRQRSNFAPKRRTTPATSRTSSLHQTDVLLVVQHMSPLTESDAALAFWMTSFATSHIGMSAIRDRIIQSVGQTADQVGLVGNGDWTLPSIWPGDAAGNDIFPDADTAGRQLYRVMYTMLSFTTLGNALMYYLQSSSLSTGAFDSSTAAVGNIEPLLLLLSSNPAFIAAVASNTAALSSLANASPLGLMPEFATDGTSVQRVDDLKFQVRGLTRITRHPLILPVVPFGISNAVLLGGRLSDWIFFGGLAAYAIAGCAAQDLRVSRKEGSVGTTFRPGDELQTFFDSTSLIPFGAIVAGKQPLGATLQEIPWLAVLVAAPVGYAIESFMVTWLTANGAVV